MKHGTAATPFILKVMAHTPPPSSPLPSGLAFDIEPVSAEDVDLSFETARDDAFHATQGGMGEGAMEFGDDPVSAIPFNQDLTQALQREQSNGPLDALRSLANSEDGVTAPPNLTSEEARRQLDQQARDRTPPNEGGGRKRKQSSDRRGVSQVRFVPIATTRQNPQPTRSPSPFPRLTLPPCALIRAAQTHQGVGKPSLGKTACARATHVPCARNPRTRC